MKITKPLLGLAAIVAVAGIAFGIHYGSNHLGGRDVVVGYSSNSPEMAQQDARRTLDAKYSTYDVVEEYGDQSGTSVETSTDYSGEQRTYRKGTWKHTIRVKNAQPRKD